MYCDVRSHVDCGPGKVRLAKWFQTMPQKQKAKIVKDVTQLVLARRTRMCNFLEYKGALNLLPSCLTRQLQLRFIDTKVVYRRYASLFFVCGIGSGDNELITLEIIHRYVEVLDRYFGNVSSPDVGAVDRPNCGCTGLRTRSVRCPSIQTLFLTEHPTVSSTSKRLMLYAFHPSYTHSF